MPADKISLRKDLKKMIKDIDLSVGDIVDDIDDTIAYIIGKHCDKEKIVKKLKEIDEDS